MTKLSIYRPPLWIAAGIAVGISSAFFLPVLAAAALTVLFCIVSLIMFVTGRVKKEFVLFSAGLFLGAMAATLYAALFPSGSYEGEIVGRITDASNCNSYGECTLVDGGYFLELDSLTVNGESVRGKASLYLPFYVRGDMDVGEYIRFTGSLTGAEFSAGEYDSLMGAKYGVYYTAAVSDYAFSLTPGKVTAVEQVRFAVRNALLDNCNGVTANFLFAMIFGDTSYLSYSVADSFRNTGTAHLFAVSGLHVALLFYACSALLNKIRMPKVIAFGIDCFILIGYSALCSFSPSVLRSAVMILVSVLCKMGYERYDALTAGGISASLLLLCAPYFLFDAGFLMSYGAVFGIIGTMKPVSNVLRKVLWRPLADGIAITISSNIGLLPFMFLYFGTVPLATIPVNLIVCPLTSLFYPFLLAATVLTTVIPQLGTLLTVAAVPTYYAIRFVQAAAEVSSAALNAAFSPLLCVYYYPLLACASTFSVAPSTIKKVCAILCLIIVVIACFVVVPV